VSKTALRLLKASSLALERSATREELLQAALAGIARVMGWPVGNVLTPTPDGKALAFSGLWHAAQPRTYAPLRKAASRSALGPKESLVGKMLRTRASCQVRDIKASFADRRRVAALLAKASVEHRRRRR
jgi:hypothetical protein